MKRYARIFTVKSDHYFANHCKNGVTGTFNLDIYMYNTVNSRKQEVSVYGIITLKGYEAPLSKQPEMCSVVLARIITEERSYFYSSLHHMYINSRGKGLCGTSLLR